MMSTIEDCAYQWSVDTTADTVYPYGQFGELLNETEQDAAENEKLAKLQKEAARARRRAEITRLERQIANGGIDDYFRYRQLL